MRKGAIAAVFASLLVSACQPPQADSSSGTSIPQGEGYDFFVLALSWSPSYCEIEGADANCQQCGGEHGFVVHGLWPQFERGWPEFCDHDAPRRVPDTLVNSMLDLMPSAGLIGHQWRKHGSCAGISQQDYFSVVRAARDRVVVPERFEDVPERVTISPSEAEQAFLQSNPGLPADGIAVTCQDRYLSEVRICLTKQLEFRSCKEVDSRSCRLPHATLPAGG